MYDSVFCLFNVKQLPLIHPTNHDFPWVILSLAYSAQMNKAISHILLLLKAIIYPELEMLWWFK